MKSKLLLVIAIMLTFALVFVACTPAGGDAPAPPADTPAETEDATEDAPAEAEDAPAETEDATEDAPAETGDGIAGTVRVLLAGFELEDTIDPATGVEREGLAAFWERTFDPKFPNITTVLTTVGWADAQQVQQVELASGNVDVLYVGGYGVQFFEQGLTRALNDLIDNDPTFDPSIYPQGLWDSNVNMIRSDGTRIGLPAVMGQRYTMFDTVLFDQWGVEHLSEYPTIDEILEAAAAMNGINPVTGEENFGIYFDPAFPLARFTFDAWSYAFNATGGVGTPERPGEIEWALDSQEMYDLFVAYGRLAELAHPGFVTSVGNERWGTEDNDIAIFLDTNGAGIITDALMTGDTSLIERFRAVMNVGPNGEGWVAVDPIVMAANPTYLEASWEVMKHLAGYERQEWFYLNYLATPALANPGFLHEIDVYTPVALAIAQHAQTTLIDSSNPFYVSDIVPVISSFHTDRSNGIEVDIRAMLEALQARAVEWSAAQ